MSYIIGIGGVRGAGKSTIARALGTIIRADIISSGRTREMIRAQYDRDKLPELFQSVNSALSIEESEQRLIIQSTIMKPSLQVAITQCVKREANLIIEGTHIYPGLLDENFNLFVLLIASKKKLVYRVHKDKNREMSKEAVDRNFQLQKLLIKKAKKNRIPIIDTDSIPGAVIEIVKLFPTKNLPITYFE